MRRELGNNGVKAFLLVSLPDAGAADSTSILSIGVSDGCVCRPGVKDVSVSVLFLGDLRLPVAVFSCVSVWFGRCLFGEWVDVFCSKTDVLVSGFVPRDFRRPADWGDRVKALPSAEIRKRDDLRADEFCTVSFSESTPSTNKHTNITA